MSRSLVRRLSSYLAVDRRNALASGVQLPDRFVGSALLADISGFTPLTEALVDHLGPRRGVDELTQILNTVYTDLVSHVHRHGGSVVCFIGDALIACFTDDLGHRATACALHMQRTMRQYRGMPAPHGGRMALAMKAAISSGTLRRFLVGDPDIRRMDVLAGEPVDRLSEAEHMARPGDVIVSSEVADNLMLNLILDEWREGLGVVAGLREPPALVESKEGTAPDSVDRLRPFLHADVHARLTSGQGDFLSELRPIAAIFLKFSGLLYDDDEAVGGKLDAYTAWVQSVVRRYGGHVLLLTTADKGSHLYAVFGALQAHEDDGQRAVAAAVALQDIPDHLAFIRDVQIGVSYGRARVGAYGGEGRRTYGAIGDAVNLAARLMGVCPPGEIRCSEAVAEAARRQWVFETLDAVQLKGMSQPQPVFRPTQPLMSRSQDHASVLVGREQELGRLLAALNDTKAGARCIRFLEGEAGIGKSRLVDEVVRLGREDGFSILFGAGDGIEHHSPYHAWRAIATDLFDLDHVPTQDWPTAIRNRMASWDPELVDRAPLLNDVLSTCLPETPTTSGLNPEVRREGLAALVGELLTCATTTHPLILILDDAHWLDSLSWDLTISVARRLARHPALILLTHRPFGELEPSEATRLSQLRGAVRMLLGPIPGDAILQVAAEHLSLPAESLPEAVGRLLVERAEGIPFYARELIRALHDTGAIRISEGSCELVDDGVALSDRIPNSLEGVVLSRLDRLPSEEQLTLKVASVVGRSFLLRAVGTIHPVGESYEQLRTQLDDATERRLTVIEMEDPEIGYAFQHIVTQQVTYDTLLFEQRRRLHHRAAEWLEDEHAENLIPHYPRLVFHWNRAEQLEAELNYCRLAGERAAKQYANAEADMYLSRALEILEQSGAATAERERYDVLKRRVRVRAILGKVEEERADLTELLAFAEADASVSGRGDILIEWADFHNRCGQFQDAADCGNEALAIMRKAGVSSGEARALSQIGKTYEEQGDFPKARDAVERARAIFERSGDVNGRAGCLKALGIIHARLGDFPLATEHFERARELYAEINDRKGEADSLGNLGALNFFLGEYEKCIEFTEQAQPMFEEMGNLSGSARCLSNLGNSYQALGAFAESLESHERALVLYEQLEDENSCADSLSDIGNALHAMGVGGYAELIVIPCGDNEMLKRARMYHKEALAIRKRIGSRSGEAISQFNLGSVYLSLGDTESARSYFEKAQTNAVELGLASIAARSLAALARANLRAGDVAVALTQSEQAMDALSDQTLADADELHFTRYLVLLEGGHPAKAREHLSVAYESLKKQFSMIESPQHKRQFKAMYQAVRYAYVKSATFPG